MTVTANVASHATICVISGIVLLLKPELLLRSPLEPYVVQWTGLPSAPLDRQALALTAIPVIALGYIHWMIIYTGDANMVRVSALGRLFFAMLNLLLLLFTDLRNTGLLTMFVVDAIGALALGAEIGFKAPQPGKFPDFTKKSQ